MPAPSVTEAAPEIAPQGPNEVHVPFGGVAVAEPQATVVEVPPGCVDEPVVGHDDRVGVAEAAEPLLVDARLDRERREHPEPDVLGEGVLVDHRHDRVEVHHRALRRKGDGDDMTSGTGGVTVSTTAAGTINVIRNGSARAISSSASAESARISASGSSLVLRGLVAGGQQHGAGQRGRDQDFSGRHCTLQGGPLMQRRYRGNALRNTGRPPLVGWFRLAAFPGWAGDRWTRQDGCGGCGRFGSGCDRTADPARSGTRQPR